MIDWVVFVICFTIILLFDEQGDRILAGKSTWFQSIWWRANLWEDRIWIVKNFLTFFIDGWHFCKFFKMLVIWFWISYLWTDSLIYAFGGAINLQLLYGFLFNKLHHRK